MDLVNLILLVRTYELISYIHRYYIDTDSKPTGSYKGGKFNHA